MRLVRVAQSSGDNLVTSVCIDSWCDDVRAAAMQATEAKPREKTASDRFTF